MKRLIIGAALLALAACGTDANPDAALRNPPTLEASGWSEAIEPMTADNIASVTLLGRLDQPETSSTLFAHTLSPDATRLAALSDEEILAWDLLTGQLVFRTGRGNATRLFYASDKTELYAVAPNAYVSILDAETGSAENNLTGHGDYAGVFALDSENDRLAFGGRDGTVKVWEMFERRALFTLNAHTSPITVLAFSPDGAQLASLAGNGAVRLWNWENGEQVAELSVTVGLPQRIAFAPDGEQIALGTEAGVWLWSLTEPTSSRLLAAENGGATEILRYSPNGAFLLGGTRGGGLYLWNAATGERIDALVAVQGNQVSADFSPDGAMLLTSALGGSVALWNLAGADQQTLNRAQLPLDEQQVYAVEWTDDSRLLLLFDATGPVYAWGIGGA